MYTTTNILIIVTLHKVAGALYISDLKRILMYSIVLLDYVLFSV